jgi:hypothetical protein
MEGPLSEWARMQVASTVAYSSFSEEKLLPRKSSQKLVNFS